MIEALLALRPVGGKAGLAILICSALISLWFAVFGGFVFYGDATQFFAYANQLVHFRTGFHIFTPGYPAVIALTGYPATGSMVPLLAVQAAFAAITPWLAFKTFSPFDRRAGIVAGIVCLASLTPFFFEDMFYHDGTALFFGFLAAAFASFFFATRHSRYIYLSVASATFVYFVQPAMVGCVIGYAVVFALFAVSDRRQIKHAAAAFGIFVVSIVAFSTFQTWTLHRDGSTAPTEQLGTRLFFNEYLLGTPYGRFTGAAADDLRNQLVRFFRSPSYKARAQELVTRITGQGGDYQNLVGRYDGREADLVDRMFAQPNRAYFELLWMVPYMPDGVLDQVFLRASLDYLYHHPLVVLGYVWRNLVDFAIGPPWACIGPEVFPACRTLQGIHFYPAVSHGVFVTQGSMSDKAYRFLNSREPSQSVLTLAAVRAWSAIYEYGRPILLAAMLFGWIASFWGPSSGLRWTLGAFIAAYFTDLLVFSLFVQPEYRYQIPGIAMCAFAAGPGISLILSWLARSVAPLGLHKIQPV